MRYLIKYEGKGYKARSRGEAYMVFRKLGFNVQLTHFLEVDNNSSLPSNRGMIIPMPYYGQGLCYQVYK